MKMFKSAADEELLITVKPWKAAQIKKKKKRSIKMSWFSIIVKLQLQVRMGKTSDVYKRLWMSWHEC